MKLRMPAYFREFRCLGGSCPDTCCRDWEVVLDEETAAYYRTVDGPLGELIRGVMTECDGEICLPLHDGFCPMLNEQKLCRIQLELGEAHLCHSCDLHPRFAEEYGALREWSLSMACPEAVRLLLAGSESIAFAEETTEEQVSGGNDLDPRLFFALLRARKIALQLIRDRQAGWPVRLERLTAFAQTFQRTLDQHRLARLDAVMDRFEQGRFPRTLPQPLSDESILARLSELEPVNGQWTQLLETAKAAPEDRLDLFEADTASMDYAYEHLMVYYVFRYFLKAVNDRQVLPRIRLAEISVRGIRRLLYGRWCQNGRLTREDWIDVIHRYSRTVEHSADNLETLYSWQW